MYMVFLLVLLGLGLPTQGYNYGGALALNLNSDEQFGMVYRPPAAKEVSGLATIESVQQNVITN